jgi:hypothetical protein
MKLRQSVLIGALGGLIIALLGMAGSTFVTEGQSILSLGYYRMPTPPIELGTFVFVDSDGKAEILRPQQICPGSEVIGSPEIFTKNRRFEVRSTVSLHLDFLPWRTRMFFPVSSIRTLQPGELIRSMFEHETSCETALASTARGRCILVVSEIIELSDGSYLVDYAGCQLIGATDFSHTVAELGAGEYYKDRFAEVTWWQRSWNSLRRPSMQVVQ